MIFFFLIPRITSNDSYWHAYLHSIGDCFFLQLNGNWNHHIERIIWFREIRVWFRWKLKGNLKFPFQGMHTSLREVS